MRARIRLASAALAAAAGALLLVAPTPGVAQEQTDFLSAPGPITIQNEKYELAWSDTPGVGYFRQNYLPEGETLQRFEKMALVELVTGDLTPELAAKAKMRDLSIRKASNPDVQFDVAANKKTGEYVLDFILTADTPDGDGVVEWNGYRYVSYKKDGKKGVVLYGISRRAYGKDREAFFKDLKKSRETNLKALVASKFPDVKLKPEAASAADASAQPDVAEKPDAGGDKPDVKQP